MMNLIDDKEEDTLNFELQNSDVVVTGATGFVGKHLVENLLCNGYKVTVLVRDVGRAIFNANSKNLSVIEFDLEMRGRMLDLPVGGTLIHCAWQDVRNTLSMKHIEEHFYSNYRFLKNILSFGIRNIIVTGTCYEYGLRCGAVSSYTQTQPNTPYALAKDCLHKALRMLQCENNYNLIWARLFYIYGDDQDPATVISQFDRALEGGEEFFNMSYGEQLFDYLSVKEVASNLTRLLNYRDGVINVCKGEPVSLRRLLERRMVEKDKSIKLNLGHYEYRRQDSMAIWGDVPFEEQLCCLDNNKGVSN